MDDIDRMAEESAGDIDDAPYAETLAFLERVAADFEPHADRDPVSADTVTYCRVAAEAVRECAAQSVEKRTCVPNETAATPRETALAAPTGETSDFETAVAFTIERVNAWLAGKPRNRPAAIEAFARFLVRDLYSYCDLAARVPAPSAPQEGPVEGSAVAKLRELADMVNGPLAPALGSIVLDNRVAEMYVGIANEILNAVETLPAPSAPQEPRGEPSEGMRAEALTALERAHTVVSELCDGTRKWIMSIPARPDHDPDLIIGNAIRLARRALSTGERDAE